MSVVASGEYASRFTSDHPIASASEDVLGRIHFARRLAEVAALARADRGLVIGLVAPWGEGKSSVLELAKRLLTEEHRAEARIVDFNPWLWSGTGQLVGQFFGEITRVAKTESSGWATIAPLLERYGGLVSNAADLPGPQAPWLKLAGKVVTFGGRIARSQVPDHADLEKWRKAIADAIRQQASKGLPRLVVFMDDLDRLLDNEIRDVAQLVKLTADFPHTVYVVAYDRSRVEKALTPSGDGRSYLEKIVQIPLTLPSPDPQSLRQVVEEALSVAIRPLRDTELWEPGRWNRLYREALSGFLRTLRDAKRFANGLLVSVIQIGGEVNGVDLVGVTALRIFVPDVYDRMRVDRELFLPTPGPGRLPRDERQRRLDELLAPIEARRRLLARAVLAELFPAMEAALAGQKPDARPKPPSIADAESYWRYFALALTPGQLPDAELRSLKEAGLSGSPDFDSRITELFKTPNGPYVARRLVSWAGDEEQLEVEQRLLILSRLLHHWNELPRATRIVNQRGPLTRRVIREIEQLPAVARAKAALDLLSAAPWNCIVSLAPDLEDEVPLRGRARTAVRNAVVMKLRVLSDDELLAGPATTALELLEKWGSDHDGRRRAERLVANDAQFLRLMSVALDEFSWELPPPTLARARAQAMLDRGDLSDADLDTLRQVIEQVDTRAEIGV